MLRDIVQTQSVPSLQPYSSTACASAAEEAGSHLAGNHRRAIVRNKFDQGSGNISLQHTVDVSQK